MKVTLATDSHALRSAVNLLLDGLEGVDLRTHTGRLNRPQDGDRDAVLVTGAWELDAPALAGALRWRDEGHIAGVLAVSLTEIRDTETEIPTISLPCGPSVLLEGIAQARIAAPVEVAQPAAPRTVISFR